MMTLVLVWCIVCVSNSWYWAPYSLFRSVRYDDPSIGMVYGVCLPVDTEPLILVREYFPMGPLDVFLQNHKDNLKVI